MSGGDRAEFLDVWQQHVTRPGSEKLLDWLDKKTDFMNTTYTRTKERLLHADGTEGVITYALVDSS